MAWLNTTDGYGGLTKLFHWLVAALFAWQYLAGHTMVRLTPETGALGLSQNDWYNWHKSIGLVALAGVVWVTQALRQMNIITAKGAALDQMSITQWIESRVPGGLASRLGQLLDVAYNIEYGAESGEQSSLNLLYLLGFGATPNNFALFGASDEVFRVKGGNAQVPAALAAQLGGQVLTSRRLVAAATLGDGRTRLTFDTPSGTQEVLADRVIMTVPFAVLRAAVDLGGLSLQPKKQVAIAQQGMGTNSKLHVQFATRHWESLGCNGETFADLGYQNTWDETRKQAGAAGILNNYTGGTLGASFGSGSPQDRAAQFLAQVEPLLPGLTAQWNGLASIDFWKGSPYQLGSYSFWKVGQYVQFAGVEREAEGTVHFAGEHTSVDAQGYMEGAVESGERAADDAWRIRLPEGRIMDTPPIGGTFRTSISSMIVETVESARAALFLGLLFDAIGRLLIMSTQNGSFIPGGSGNPPASDFISSATRVSSFDFASLIAAATRSSTISASSGFSRARSIATALA